MHHTQQTDNYTQRQTNKTKIDRRTGKKAKKTKTHLISIEFIG